MKIEASALGMIEGPVTCQDGAVVVTSLDLGKVFRTVRGATEMLADTGGGANGATEGADGRIYIAQNGGTGPALNYKRSPAGVQVVSRSGEIHLFGTAMTAPNDLCFGPDGMLYVTDPTRKPERDEGRIWRCDVATGLCEQVFECDWYPNGIGFSVEDDMIYIADSRHARIVRMPLSDMRAHTAETFIEIDHGSPDGFAFDMDGRLVVACPAFGPEGGDVQVYAQGKLAQVIKPGTARYYTNVAISGDAVLYVCDADNGELLSMPWQCPGLPLHPFRTGHAPRSAAAQLCERGAVGSAAN